jgi:hypothetical protein
MRVLVQTAEAFLPSSKESKPMENTDFLANMARSSGQIKTLCDHCSNVSYKQLVCKDEAEAEDRVFVEYRLYRCTICHNVVLVKITRCLPDDYQGSRQPQDRIAAATTTEERQLWPEPLSLPLEIPDRVRRLYEEARLVRRSPSSFVMQLGRALAAVTKDKGAAGHNLYERFNWLTSQDLLPDVFGQMAQINRILRNWGAHDSETEIEPEDARIADEFFRAIVEYLYIAPAKVDRIKDLISRRQNKS